MMYVGILQLSFHIPGARSLKDKRQVIRSFRDRVRARYMVSIAEVGFLDLHQRAILGVAVVSNSAALCDELLSHVSQMAEHIHDAILIDRKNEVLTVDSHLGESMWLDLESNAKNIGENNE